MSGQVRSGQVICSIVRIIRSADRSVQFKLGKVRSGLFRCILPQGTQLCRIGKVTSGQVRSDTHYRIEKHYILGSYLFGFF